MYVDLTTTSWRYRGGLRKLHILFFFPFNLFFIKTRALFMTSHDKPFSSIFLALFAIHNTVSPFSHTKFFYYDCTM